MDGALPAFPGAEGAGANAIGGRAGDVYHVTNLNDTGAGSLRNGISTAPAAGRTIVFDISGTIALASELNVNKPKITIAGQTAPGQGITLKDRKFRISNSDVVVRHIRARLGTDDAQQVDTVEITGGTNVILDHVTASWSVDETLSVTDTARNVSVQNTFITESLHQSIHSEGAHGYASLLRADGVGAAGTDYSFHHNLYATHFSRNPRPGTFATTDLLRFDFRNNVVYNWQDQAGYTSGTDDRVNMNYVGNYLVAGPLTPAGGKSTRAFTGGNSAINIYQLGNKIDSDHDGIHDGTDTGWGMFSGTYTMQGSPYAVPGVPVTTDSADDAYLKVLASGGAFPWLRDAVDARVAGQVLTETSPPTIIDSVEEAGGYPTLPVETRPVGWDTDNDGMPNWWETARGLNPAVAGHTLTTLTPASYTDLDHYLNYLTLFAQWNANSDGNWGTFLNWRGMLPSSVDATATFGSAITAPRLITVNSPQVVGQMLFDNSNAYTIAGGGGITMDVISGTAFIDVAAGSHAISTPLTLANDTRITLAQAGDTLTLSDFQQTSSALTKAGAGTLVVNKLRAAGVTVAGGVVRIAANGADSATSALGIVQTSSGRLDVTNNKLIVTGMSLSAVNAQILAGRNGGSWNGNGIITSETDASPASMLTTLAVATADDVEKEMFGGISVADDDVLVMYTYAGDADLTGEIDGDDYFRIDAGIVGNLSGYANGDFDYNGVINADDYWLIDRNYSRQDGPPGGVTSVPEPAGAVLLAIAIAATCRFGRSRSSRRRTA